ncbi:MAG: hypothetical protein Q8K63_04700 [Acidimicrobiales bacterium]|nr:hypothetical protein [Acidimicrobiales bacterium]
MLQLPALELWNGDKSGLKDSLSFAGVFVPTDLVWRAQLQADSSIEEVPFKTDLEHLGTAAFHNHILTAFVTTVEQRLAIASDSAIGRFALRIAPATERELAQALSASFSLVDPVSTLSAVRSQLRRRLEDLGLFRRRLNRVGVFDPPGPIEDLIDLDFMAVLGSAAAAVDELADGAVHRWGLCFDELELCPLEIRQRLLHLLRSTDSQFVFKFAISPYDDDISSFNVIGAAQAGHDFEIVNLTHGRRSAIDSFSRQLVDKVLASRELSGGPAKVFGRSIMSDLPRKTLPSAPYSPNSPQVKTMRQLAVDDASFAAYLLDKDLDLDTLGELPKPTLHRYVRKVIHYVAIRDAYRPRDTGGAPRHQGLLPYTGVPLVYALCDGNPRLLIGVINSMLAHIESGKVPEDAQAAIIREAVERLRSLLRTIGARGTDVMSDGPEMSLMDFLDRIGRYFRSTLLDEPFRADPPGSFLVDDAAAVRYTPLLGLALNAGAIIHVASGGGRVLRDVADLVDQRFRLSYLLGAHYRLPLRLDRAVNLTAVMARPTAVLPHTATQQLPGLEG